MLERIFWSFRIEHPSFLCWFCMILIHFEVSVCLPIKLIWLLQDCTVFWRILRGQKLCFSPGFLPFIGWGFLTLSSIYAWLLNRLMPIQCCIYRFHEDFRWKFGAWYFLNLTSQLPWDKRMTRSCKGERILSWGSQERIWGCQSQGRIWGCQWSDVAKLLPPALPRLVGVKMKMRWQVRVKNPNYILCIP